MQLAANQKRAQDRNQRDGQDGRCGHGEGLGECQRVKHLAFHPGQREHRYKREDDDDHGERDRPPHQPRGLQRDLPDVLAIAAVLLVVLLRLANHVFGHHDAGIDQYADGDRDSAQRHDVRADVRALHEQKRAKDGQRQRNGDDENAAEVPQEENVRQRDEDDLFDQRVAQRVHGVIDEDAAIVERHDLHVGRKTGLNLRDLAL